MPNAATEARLTKLQLLPESPPEARAQAFAEAREAAADPDRLIRAAACEGIAATANPSDGLQLLGRLAQDSDVGVRHAAVIAIAGLPWGGRLDLLAHALSDEDLGVVAVAADGLSYAGDRRAIPMLHELIAEKQLQFGALEGLYALQDERLPSIARPLFAGFLTPLFEKTMAALALARTGDVEALQHVRRRVRKKFSPERGFLVMHLAGADVSEGRAFVESLASSPSDDQRESALLSLARLEPDRWLPELERALAENLDGDPQGAAEVLFGLAQIDWARAGGLATEHLSRTDALGAAARRVLLGASLRAAFPAEILARCA